MSGNNAPRLKSAVNQDNVVTLRRLVAPGIPVPRPRISFDDYELLRNTKPLNKKAGDRQMENKPAQNIQDTFLNTVRKDKTPITIYLVSGVKLTGKIRSFDKYSVLLENNSQEQLIFKHAISTVVSNRSVLHTEHRPAGVATGTVPGPVGVAAAPASIAEQR
jgi:host factor-I protein